MFKLSSLWPNQENKQMRIFLLRQQRNEKRIGKALKKKHLFIGNPRFLLGRKHRAIQEFLTIMRESLEHQPLPRKAQELSRILTAHITEQQFYLKKNVRFDAQDIKFGTDIRHVLAAQLVEDKNKVAQEREVARIVKEKILQMEYSSRMPFDRETWELFQREYTKSVEGEHETEEEEKDVEGLLSEERIVLRALDELDAILNNQKDCIKKFLTIRDSANFDKKREELESLLEQEKSRYTILLHYHSIAKRILFDLAKRVEDQIDLGRRGNFFLGLRRRGTALAMLLLAGWLYATGEVKRWDEALQRASMPVAGQVEIETEKADEPEFKDFWDWIRKGGKTRSAKEIDRKIGREIAVNLSIGLKEVADYIGGLINKEGEKWGHLWYVYLLLRALSYAVNHYIITATLLMYFVFRSIPFVGFLPKKFEKELLKGMLLFGKDVKDFIVFLKKLIQKYDSELKLQQPQTKVTLRDLLLLIQTAANTHSKDAYRWVTNLLKRKT